MRKKYFSIAALLFVTILFSSFLFYGYQIVKSPNILIQQEDRTVTIPDSATFADVQRIMRDENIVNNLTAFSFLAKIMKYDRRIIPGTYLLKKDMNNREAILLLRSGSQVPVNITFNSIRLPDEIAAKIVRNTGISEKEFQEALEKYVHTNDRGFTAETIISMFIPNTYQVYYTTSGEELVKRMEREYDVFWNETRKEKAEKLGLTPMEVSTLASIVKAESSKPDENPRIAGLYVNRLKRGIALQADPTLVFALGDFSIKRVLNVHKEIDSPYNTYKYPGLPPGPINMPSIAAIDAVLNHEKHNFIYMCAREDFSGYHNFTTSLREHNLNANRYQRALDKEMLKARLNNR